MVVPKITSEDMALIYRSLSDTDKKKLKEATILVTGFAGSLGYSLLHFLDEYGEQLDIKKVYGIDNYMFGKPKWVERMVNHDLFDLRELDIISCELDFCSDADLIFHMASLASPVYYRMHPLKR